MNHKYWCLLILLSSACVVAHISSKVQFPDAPPLCYKKKLEKRKWMPRLSFTMNQTTSWGGGNVLNI